MCKALPGNVLIFGGSGVIGRSIARTFGLEGWKVGLHYHRHQSLAEETATLIQASGGQACLFQADIQESRQTRIVLQNFHKAIGSLNVLIWAVGISISALTIKTSQDEWHRVLNTNLTGAFHALQAAFQFFSPQHGGSIILLGSFSGEQGMSGQAAYAASKAGLIGLMQTAAREWGEFHVRVNTIFPGWHPSPLSAPAIHIGLQQSPHVLPHLPSLGHVAQTVYHLATTPGVSGQVWNLDSRIW